MRISDWSSDVCSSDLQVERSQVARYRVESNVFRHMGRRPDRRIDDDLLAVVQGETKPEPRLMNCEGDKRRAHRQTDQQHRDQLVAMRQAPFPHHCSCALPSAIHRSEEHTSELQSLMRISYAVFCLKKKN